MARPTYGEEMEEAQDLIAQLKGELGALQETLEEKSGAVEGAKRTANKVSKVLDQALKEIGLKVRKNVIHLSRCI